MSTIGFYTAKELVAHEWAETLCQWLEDKTWGRGGPPLTPSIIRAALVPLEQIVLAFAMRRAQGEAWPSIKVEIDGDGLKSNVKVAVSPAPVPLPYCGVPRPGGFLLVPCDREKGHQGDHSSRDIKGLIVFAWPQEEKPPCEAKSLLGFTCNEPKGHVASHVASENAGDDTYSVLSVWPQESKTEVANNPAFKVFPLTCYDDDKTKILFATEELREKYGMGRFIGGNYGEPQPVVSSAAEVDVLIKKSGQAKLAKLSRRERELLGLEVENPKPAVQDPQAP